jgi:hypothetical protein
MHARDRSDLILILEIQAAWPLPHSESSWDASRRVGALSKSDVVLDAMYRAVRVLGFNWLFAVFPLPDLASRVAASEVVEYWNT